LPAKQRIVFCEETLTFLLQTRFYLAQCFARDYNRQ